MIRKQKEQVKERDTGNAYILNVITPAGIDFTDNHASVGECCGRIYAITRYPETPDYGWLAPLCNLEGTSTVIEYRYTAPDAMIAAFDKRISELRSKKEVEKKQSERDILDMAISDLENMIKRISVQKEPVGYFNIMLHVQDMRYADLENRIKKVNAQVSVEECSMRLLRFKQIDALKSVSPYYIPNRMVANVGARNMPISTFIGGFPMAASSINDPEGYVIGKVKQTIAILNMWIRDKDRTNSNWFLSGVPGVGKSTFIKLLILMEHAVNGTKQIIWDAENEYIDLVKHPWVGGEIIDAASGATGRINPLQVRAVPRITPDDLDSGESMEDYMLLDESGGVSDVALHVQWLRMFFDIYFGRENMSKPGMRAALERIIIVTYEKYEIDFSTDITGLKPEDYPIMEDLYRTAGELANDESVSERRRNTYEELQDLLYSPAVGADKFLWNGHTTLNPKKRTIVLNTSNLLELDDNVRNAQFFNLQQWSWNEMSGDRTDKCLTIADEGYLFVDSDNPVLLKFFRNISKRDRKYEAGLIFATHAVNDILDPAIKRYGQAIIDNSCYKMIMGCDAQNLADTKRLLNLSDKEEMLLESKTRGKGILFAGNSRMDLDVMVRDTFLEMFGSGGGR